MSDLQEILNINSEAIRMERDRCINAVDAEPELPGDMPKEMADAINEAFKNEDVDFFINGLRLAVKLTKEGIRERIVSG